MKTGPGIAFYFYVVLLGIAALLTLVRLVALLPCFKGSSRFSLPSLSNLGFDTGRWAAIATLFTLFMLNAIQFVVNTLAGVYGGRRSDRVYLLNSPACVALGILLHFFYLLIFVWMAVLNLDSAIRKRYGKAATGILGKRIWWGYLGVTTAIPLLIIAIAVGIDYTPNLGPKDRVIRPEYGQSQCFLVDTAIHAYATGIVTALFALSIIAIAYHRLSKGLITLCVLAVTWIFSINLRIGEMRYDTPAGHIVFSSWKVIEALLLSWVLFRKDKEFTQVATEVTEMASS